MTPIKFRQLALSLPKAEESNLVARVDFLVHGKVFASLFPNDGWGVIKLARELQLDLVHNEPSIFEACDGAWGRNGATKIFLDNAEEGSTLRALISAYRKHAPKALIAELDDE